MKDSKSPCICVDWLVSLWFISLLKRTGVEKENEGVKGSLCFEIHLLMVKLNPRYFWSLYSFKNEPPQNLSSDFVSMEYTKLSLRMLEENIKTCIYIYQLVFLVSIFCFILHLMCKHNKYRNLHQYIIDDIRILAYLS